MHRIQVSSDSWRRHPAGGAEQPPSPAGVFGSGGGGGVPETPCPALTELIPIPIAAPTPGAETGAAAGGPRGRPRCLRRSQGSQPEAWGLHGTWPGRGGQVAVFLCLRGWKWTPGQGAFPLTGCPIEIARKAWTLSSEMEIHNVPCKFRASWSPKDVQRAQ